MDAPDFIENISRDPILSIAEVYGRITINDVWYLYERETDRLIRCTNFSPSQAVLFEMTQDEQ